jgi:hypothetical protein
METQSDMQPAPRQGFRRGRSGNPSGQTRTRRRSAEFAGEFRRVHGREPTLIESVTVRNAAALAARLEGNRIPVEDIVRCCNALTRLLAKLKLDREVKPDNPQSARSVPSLGEIRARRAKG